MTPEQIERNREFLKDLRANQKKVRKCMRSSGGGRCCLAVALDSAIAQGYQCPETWGDRAFLPPDDMAEDFYGWPGRSPMLIGPDGVTKHHADGWNDGKDCQELSHAEIADAFERTFPELKQAP
jgi:hypothetical protein